MCRDSGSDSTQSKHLWLPLYDAYVHVQAFAVMHDCAFDLYYAILFTFMQVVPLRQQTVLIVVTSSLCFINHQYLSYSLLNLQIYLQFISKTIEAQ